MDKMIVEFSESVDVPVLGLMRVVATPNDDECAITIDGGRPHVIKWEDVHDMERLSIEFEFTYVALFKIAIRLLGVAYRHRNLLEDIE